MNPAAARDFLAELARAVPALPRAACREHVEVFDSDKPDDKAAAVDICETACPCYSECARWAAAQPRRALSGIVAGRDYTYTFRPPTKKKASTAA